MRRQIFIFALMFSQISPVAHLSQTPLPRQKTETSSIAQDPERARQNLAIFDAVWKKIDENYYDKNFNGVDWKKSYEILRPRAEAASDDKHLGPILLELIQQLKDKHVEIFGPDVVQFNKKHLKLAIGVSLREAEGKLVVDEVTSNSLEAKAGVSSGWVLLEVNGVSAATMIASGSGPSFELGDTVKYRLLDDREKDREVSFTCCPVITDAPVQVARMLDNNALYIRFDAFEKNTDKWFARTIRDHPEARALIIDLRNNYGGLLEALKECLRPLFSQRVVVGERISRKAQDKNLEVQGEEKHAFTGTVFVLTSGNTASAGEIFAATIQESARGKVVGHKTAGAVLLSRKESLPCGWELQYSFEDFVTERGHRLEGSGVTPDVPVTPRFADLRQGKDPELLAVQDLLKKM